MGPGPKLKVRRPPSSPSRPSKQAAAEALKAAGLSEQNAAS